MRLARVNVPIVLTLTIHVIRQTQIILHIILSHQEPLPLALALLYQHRPKSLAIHSMVLLALGPFSEPVILVALKKK